MIVVPISRFMKCCRGLFVGIIYTKALCVVFPLHAFAGHPIRAQPAATDTLQLLLLEDSTNGCHCCRNVNPRFIATKDQPFVQEL